MRKTLIITALAATVCMTAAAAPKASQTKPGIWTSKEELALIPMEGPGWETVIKDANKKMTNPDVGNQNDNTNCYVLAAAIASARYDAAGNAAEAKKYADKVIATLEKLVEKGCPPDSRSLAWAREVGAYAMAADIIGYRTEALLQYMNDAADKWICPVRKQTLHKMSLQRPNNWGTMAFGSLCAIYAYTGNWAELQALRDKWVTALEGPADKKFKFGSDLSWQADPSNPLVINAKGTKKDGVILDGLQPEEMRRGAAFNSKTIAPTGYPFEAMQGLMMAARILDRQGIPIWEVGDRALYRAVYALQVYLTDNFGKEWSYKGDDLWQLKFIDVVYGSDFSGDQDVWGHGKNTGYPYVALNESPIDKTKKSKK